MALPCLAWDPGLCHDLPGPACFAVIAKQSSCSNGVAPFAFSDGIHAGPPQSPRPSRYSDRGNGRDGDGSCRMRLLRSPFLLTAADVIRPASTGSCRLVIPLATHQSALFSAAYCLFPVATAPLPSAVTQHD